ncbi:hypothetical protein F2Q69_00052924 [Brassica cretica]|uniref:Potassium channel n=1 Tax=Brassica cretica TaxID=69181 RepID=A0A8S9MT43_BRACR|nr:hypothetical protein F2Q69_00052924 [Brassica cretica]
MEFGFFRGLPENLFVLDIVGQIAFLVDIVLQFFVAFQDKHTYRTDDKPTHIAHRYLKSHFFLDLVSCFPWDLIYKASGKHEVVRYILWIRLFRVRKVIEFFQRLEKDTRINYLFTRILKLIFVEVYCTHTAACIFYYLATTLPAENEGYTWIGSLKLGDYSYENFRKIDIWKRYTTSLYFAIVTMATVGYGDIHAVNLREMIFVMIYVSFDMVLGAYLIGVLIILLQASGKHEVVRYILWIRLFRVRKVIEFFQRLEKDTRINYLFTRILKLIFVEVYCTHTAACIFYYLATTLPAENEGYTWIGSLKLGDYSYENFRKIDIWKRYTTSLYFAIVTMATVGYGDIHAVNLREMIFVMIYVSFDMVLGAYLIGNITALIVKGSNTERFRDKMNDLASFMNRKKLRRDIRSQITHHVRSQYDSKFTNTVMLQDIPASIRAKIAQLLYTPYIEKIPLFKGCSSEFINQIVVRLHEEYFFPGEIITEQGNVVDHLYFVCEGSLEALETKTDGTEDLVELLEPHTSFGDISIICNISQPFTIRVRSLCHLLRLDKQSFSNILEIYFHDGRKILNNLMEGKESNERIKKLESDVMIHIGKQEAELALKVNSAAFQGDIYQLKSLVRSGADPNKTDYDGRAPLHLAASRGYEDITLFLIQEGVDINQKDKFGNTPLLEAVKAGQDRVIDLLVKEGASFDLEDAGNFLCTVVVKGDSDFLKRLLSSGMDPNTEDYDHRTPLHVAASEGLFLMAKMLVEAGASVVAKDR